MSVWPTNTVAVSSFFKRLDISNQLLAIYKKNRWVKSIGRGAYIKYTDTPDYKSALYALQKQSCMTIHPGGKTALSLLGKSHYLEFQIKSALLFGHSKEKLPTWMKDYDWGIKLDYNQTSFLPPTLGLVEYSIGEYTILVSDSVRAFLECLLLAPKEQEIIECFEILEGMNDLRPNKINQYLNLCSSVKVKRLFLYLAEKANHQWFQYIDIDLVDLGKGKRSLADKGIYSNKYKITVPKVLKEYGKHVL